MLRRTAAQRYADHMRTEIEELLSFFEYAQLPGHLQAQSKPFHELAHNLARTTLWSHELAASLRAILIGKDAAVRALLVQKRYEGVA